MLPSAVQDWNIRVPPPPIDSECVDYCNTAMEREQDEREMNECCRVSVIFCCSVTYWILGIIYLNEDDSFHFLWFYCLMVEIFSICLSCASVYLFHTYKPDDYTSTSRKCVFLGINTLFITYCAIIGGFLIFFGSFDLGNTNLYYWALVSWLISVIYFIIDIVVYGSTLYYRYNKSELLMQFL
jgi:hypothetical protein